jgi:hypothetical protein
MNRQSFSKRAAAVAFGLAGLAAAGAAQARSDVYMSIGVGTPVYVQPQPVYVQPQPVYVQPQPVYVQPRPVYVQPQPVYVQPQVVYGHPRRGPWGDRDGDGIPNVHDRYDNRQHWGHGQRQGAWGDADRDGVPNRHDGRPNNPYRY